MPGDPAKIFLYEDDGALAEEIVRAFAKEGLGVAVLEAAVDLLALGRELEPCVVIMDRLVGDLDSLTLLDALRGNGGRIAVCIISSLASVDDRIRGIKAGGDDYLVKPFAMGELIARVEALRRRAGDDRRTNLTVGPLVLDLIDRTARRGARTIALLPREFGLLEYLMRHAGQTVTRAMLLENVWRFQHATQTNVVDVYVGNLRRKVDGEGETRLIESVRGLGFKLVASDNRAPGSS